MTRKKYLMLFALLLSIIVWLIIKLLQEQTTTINFSIRIVNIPENIYIFDNKDIKIPVMVKGTGLNILVYYLSNASIDYNGSDIVMGDNFLDIERIRASLPYHKTLEFTTIQSDNPFIISTDRILQKRVPVVFDFYSERDRERFIENNYTFDDIYVTLSGPSVDIQRLDKVHSERISADFMKRKVISIRLVSVGEQVVIIPPFIELQQASEIISTRTFSFLPIHVSSDISIFPQRVTIIIEGKQDFLNTLTDNDIYAYVTDNDNNELDIHFTLPDNVKIVDFTPTKVSVSR